MNHWGPAVVVCLLASPLAAHAQSASLFVSVSAGVNVMPHENEETRFAGSAAPEEVGQVSTSTGPALVGAIGRDLRKGLRMQIEVSYRANRIKGDSRLAGEDLGSATERKYGGMVNGLYDLHRSRITPYVGGGVGGQFVHEPNTVSSSGGIEVSVEGGTKIAFAYQLLAGAAFAIRDGLAVIADYHFLDLVGSRTFKGTATIPGAGSLAFTDRSSHDQNHSVVVGIRCAFGG